MRAYFLSALFLLSIVVAAQIESKPVPFLDWKGKRFPLQEWITVNGDTLKQKDFEGKVCFFCFFEVGCPPCVQEIPYLNQLRKHFENSADVSVVGFFSGTKQCYFDYFLSEKNFQKIGSNSLLKLAVIPIPKCSIVAIDPNICKYRYNVMGFPSNLILDKNAIVRYLAPGFHVDQAKKEKLYSEFLEEVETLRVQSLEN